MSVGCGDHTSAFLTKPPKVPAGYEVFYTKSHGTTVAWRSKPETRNPDGTLDRNQVMVPFNVLRVGVEKGVIFGLREDPTTKQQSAFYVDTNANTATLDVPPAELDGHLKDLFSITHPRTVPARFYDRNADGGRR